MIKDKNVDGNSIFCCMNIVKLKIIHKIFGEIYSQLPVSSGRNGTRADKCVFQIKVSERPKTIFYCLHRPRRKSRPALQIGTFTTG